MNPIVYLHGFASGPSSRKARHFAERLGDEGVDVEIPALDSGDFRNLTITGQLDVISRAAAGRPVALIGSSMGGYLAALYASLHPEVTKLVLLAPAFYFPQRWEEYLGPQKVSEWQEKGEIDFFHHSDQTWRALGYGLVADGLRYPPAPDFTQPALIFHGKADDTVPYEYSVRFAETHPNVTLHLLESGHELTDMLDVMWRDSREFLLG